MAHLIGAWGTTGQLRLGEAAPSGSSCTKTETKQRLAGLMAALWSIQG